MGADLFWECDPTLHYTYVSDSYRTLTGVDPSKVIGRRIDETVGPCLVPANVHRRGSRAKECPFTELEVAWTKPMLCTAASV